MKTVYFFAVDEDGQESASVPISLGPDGTADISALPQGMQQTFIKLGIRNALHTGLIFPKDGQSFLEGLLEIANSAWRFRTSPEKFS